MDLELRVEENDFIPLQITNSKGKRITQRMAKGELTVPENPFDPLAPYLGETVDVKIIYDPSKGPKTEFLMQFLDHSGKVTAQRYLEMDSHSRGRLTRAQKHEVVSLETSFDEFDYDCGGILGEGQITTHIAPITIESVAPIDTSSAGIVKREYTIKHDPYSLQKPTTILTDRTVLEQIPETLKTNSSSYVTGPRMIKGFLGDKPIRIPQQTYRELTIATPGMKVLLLHQRV